MIESVTATRRGRVVRSPDLGLEWIAEGVEGTHARDGLRALGCRYGHGSRTATCCRSIRRTEEAQCDRCDQ